MLKYFSRANRPAHSGSTEGHHSVLSFHYSHAFRTEFSFALRA